MPIQPIPGLGPCWVADHLRIRIGSPHMVMPLCTASPPLPTSTVLPRHILQRRRPLVPCSSAVSNVTLPDVRSGGMPTMPIPRDYSCGWADVVEACNMGFGS
ncbi:hypothetical protein U9M48_044506 [Paspalum notatum var. saurae]|uniref:Uncharacterized protein n=1 Tax=Paspalum notatum var. saurae TaxID=547442 RepID=A0AAQ3UZD1_PASNO